MLFLLLSGSHVGGVEHGVQGVDRDVPRARLAAGERRVPGAHGGREEGGLGGLREREEGTQQQ